MRLLFKRTNWLVIHKDSLMGWFFDSNFVGSAVRKKDFLECRLSLIFVAPVVICGVGHHEGANKRCD